MGVRGAGIQPQSGLNGVHRLVEAPKPELRHCQQRLPLGGGLAGGLSSLLQPCDGLSEAAMGNQVPAER